MHADLSIANVNTHPRTHIPAHTHTHTHTHKPDVRRSLRRSRSWADRLACDMTHSYVTDSFTCHELRHMSQITLPYTISQTGRLACDMIRSYVTDSFTCHELRHMSQISLPYTIRSYVTDSSWLVTNSLWLFHMSRTPLDFFTYTLMSLPATGLTHTSRTPRGSPKCHELLLTYVLTFPHTFSWARLRHVSFQRHGLFMAHSYITNSPWPIHMSQILLTHLYVTHSVEIGSSTTWVTHTSRTAHNSSICHELLSTHSVEISSSTSDWSRANAP